MDLIFKNIMEIDECRVIQERIDLIIVQIVSKAPLKASKALQKASKALKGSFKKGLFKGLSSPLGSSPSPKRPGFFRPLFLRHLL